MRLLGEDIFHLEKRNGITCTVSAVTIVWRLPCFEKGLPSFLRFMKNRL